MGWEHYYFVCVGGKDRSIVTEASHRHINSGCLQGVAQSVVVSGITGEVGLRMDTYHGLQRVSITVTVSTSLRSLAVHDAGSQHVPPVTTSENSVSHRFRLGAFCCSHHLGALC